ncbi:hypothetical protein ABB37_03666 [Leptomonas pyrrhocoris]|uniref:Uncharacterized protein n=1 Tax=Leptomonas pyrrhocoris TaxID=157538 RepID=A0A0M9G381_LEPPY|nr:hypothetical protein ABB37_03666 [Leptomonas pyrrhocoris]XP_015659688.1 hypothetical protein ABB37_03666 [Leptomonas pyrrhocoris]KPA81248.1 hypothetical protein ABB37_03666 [Leptomonas pyrrhocoris]KPA81249.1 hypothetical protein ABB37_03666 [Leptomonas pyrrhocoris]|eukprot:XP_015659687.1 hypothetical protein ABB37_03666 [Leptomonas pyrrhocoris]
MSTVQELQAQLDALRVQHVSDIETAQAALSKLQEDLNNVQADTDNLKQEEAELNQQFGESKDTTASSQQSPYKDIVVQVLHGLVHCDESKCSSS